MKLIAVCWSGTSGGTEWSWKLGGVWDLVWLDELDLVEEELGSGVGSFRFFPNNLVFGAIL